MGREKIPTEGEYAKAVLDKDKPTVKCRELNEQAYFPCRRLMLPNSDPSKLKIEDVQAKLNHQYDHIHNRSHEDNDDAGNK